MKVSMKAERKVANSVVGLVAWWDDLKAGNLAVQKVLHSAANSADHWAG